ncbi:MAG: TolC family protein, partial [Planctomycetes bacterium]|nr:TolC family protein [Planctomycetota bacterium]
MNANRQTSRVVLGAALLAAAWLPSCATRAVPVQSPATVPASFSASGQAPLPGTWWTSLGDAELNALVDQALAGNFSLRSAWDRLDQSRATARRSGADLWPSLTGSGDATRTRVKNDGAQRIYSTDYSLGLVASYEIDLWGRVRSTRDAAALDVYATTEDLHAAAITLTAEVARAWYRLIEQRGQLRLLDDQVTTNEKYLEIITLRFRRGQVSATDVLQQRQLVEKTRGERSVVESSIAVLESQLAVLLGRAPGSLTIADDRPLPQVPA